MSATLFKRGIVLLSVTALIALSAGCSSDNKSTNSDLGSLTDPAFQEVQSEVNVFIDSMFVAMTAGFSSYNEVPITNNDINLFYGPVNPGQTQSSYEYTVDGWHHITFTSNDGVKVVGVNDSIQFMANNMIQQSSTNADAMNYRHHWASTAVNQNSDFTNSSGDVNYAFASLTGSMATISGSYGYTANNHTMSANPQIDNEFMISSTATGVQVQRPIGGWSTGCPSSGSVSFSVMQTKISNDTVAQTVDTTVTNWTGAMVFSNGVAQVSISNGTTQWVYSSSVCQPAN